MTMQSTSDDATAPLKLAGVETGQWRLTSLSVVNWGNYEHATLTFDAETTAIMGASGAGKSTLLDAYSAILSGASTTFNAASNDAGSRAGRRNLVSYVRGQLDDAEDSTSSEAKSTYLRGTDNPTWTAIATNFESGDSTLAAVMLCHAKRGETETGNVKRIWAITPHPIENLLELEPTTPEPFTESHIKRVYPSASTFQRGSAFTSDLHARLGIGAPGESKKAVEMAHRIQQGIPLDSVSHVYKTMVLDRPDTFEYVDRIVAQFDDLDALHKKTVDAEKQQDTLKRLPQLKQEYDSASEAVEAINLLNVGSRNGQWRKWLADKEATLVAEDLERVKAQATECREQQRQLNEDRANVEDQIEAVRSHIDEAGGGSLDALSRQIESYRGAVNRTTAERAKFDGATELVGPVPSHRAEFAAWQDSAQREVEQHQVRLSEAQNTAVQASTLVSDLKKSISEKESDLEGLQRRGGRIMGNTHSARVRFADAFNVDQEALPFVAELVDIKPEYEQWRSAIELALGGLVKTLLVDNTQRRDFQRAINPLTTTERIRNQGVTTGEPLTGSDDETMLLGRVTFKEHPYAGWVSRRIAEDFNYRCVDHVGELNSYDKALTVTGQVKDTHNRGAHGGQPRHSILGYRNTALLAELGDELATLKNDLAEAEDGDKKAWATLESVKLVHEQLRAIADADWELLDLDTAQRRLDDAEAQHRKLSTDPEIAELKSELDKLQAARDDLVHRSSTAGDVADKAEATVRAREERQRRLAEYLDDTPTLVHAAQRKLCESIAEEWPEQITLDTWQQFTDWHNKQVNRLFKDKSAALDRAASDLVETFGRYNRDWPDPERSDTLADYETFAEILDDLNRRKLPEARIELREAVDSWTGDGVRRLKDSMEAADSANRERLAAVNDVLNDLPFGADRGRLQIELRNLNATDIKSFRAKLREVGSHRPDRGDDATRDEQWMNELREFINSIRDYKKDKAVRRLLDVREHAKVVAVADNPRRPDQPKKLLDKLGRKSGGESQEISAFVIAAALRFRLGDSQATRPRFAPVLLDEGFVKADALHAGRAINAWKSFGFQLVIAAPDNTFAGFEERMNLSHWVSKNDSGKGQIAPIEEAERYYASRARERKQKA